MTVVTILVVLLLFLLGAALLLFMYGVGIYNGLIKKRNGVDGAWSDIDVQLQRRYDLIPNLVETVKGYAKHENQTLEAVIKARQQAVNITASDATSSPQKIAAAENMLTGALRQLFAVAEAYPDLKANENFIMLQNDLSEIEDKLQLARRYYNATVLEYNNMRQVFPSSLIAGMFHFEAKEFFELEAENARVAPSVKF